MWSLIASGRLLVLCVLLSTVFYGQGYRKVIDIETAVNDTNRKPSPQQGLEKLQKDISDLKIKVDGLQQSRNGNTSQQGLEKLRQDISDLNNKVSKLQQPPDSPALQLTLLELSLLISVVALITAPVTTLWLFRHYGLISNK
jgi:septal ring factor EnvC (AmiA/AmiB activator)